MVEQVKTKSEPRARFRGFTDEWEQVKLGDVGNITTGSTPSTSISDYYSEDNSGLLWVTPTDISDSPVIRTTSKSLTSKGATKVRLLEPNSLLITCIASIGKNALLLEKGATNQQINALTAYADYDPYFLYTQSEKWTPKLKALAGTGTMEIINKTELSLFFTMTPALPEQQKIGELFQTLDKAIDLSNTQVANLKQQKKALLQRLFPQKGETEPKVRLRGFTDEWEEVKLGDLVNDGLIELSRGNVIPKGSNDGTYPVYSSSVTNKGLFTTIDDYMFDEELITWSIDGGGDFFYRPKHKFSVTNVSGVLQVLSEDVDINFLYAQLSVLHTKKTFDYLLKAHPSVIKTLYTLHIPSLDEQQAIGELFQTLDEQIRLAADKVSQYKELKQALLQRLFV